MRTLTVAKKEFRDHISDQTFLLSFLVLLIVVAGGAYVLVLNAQDSALNLALRGQVIAEGQIWKENFGSFTYFISGPFSALAVFVAIAMSFNSMNKERTEGSLKVLLSYPIRRWEVILGKLLGGFLVVSVVTLATMIISFSIVMYFLGIPPTADFLLRAISVTGLGITLLFFYLCVGTAISSIVRDTSAALVGTLLVVVTLRAYSISVVLLLLSIVYTYLGVRASLPQSLFYVSEHYLYLDSSYRSFWVYSPSEAFLGYSNNIFQFQNVGYATGEPVYIPIEFEWLLPKNLDLVWSIIAFTVVALIVCLVIFSRRDVE